MTITRLTEVRKKPRQRDSRFEDEPICPACGAGMTKQGQAYVCPNCGEQLGRS